MFAKADEKLKNTLLFKIAKNVYTGEDIPPDTDDVINNDKLFRYQAKVLKELAKKESFVVIGRCADFILKDYPNVVSVFVHGSAEFNLARAMEQNSMTEEEMKKFIAKTDKYRAEYYKHYTGRDWTDARNYDLCLNSSKLGFEKCVEEIKAYMNVRF